MTAYQTFLVGIFDVSVKLLWFLELLTASNIKKLLKSYAYLVVISMDVLFFGFVFFAFNTGYMREVANGVFVTINGYPRIDNSASQVLGASSSRTLPLKIKELPDPIYTAKAVFAVDNKTGKILFEKNPHDKYAPASTTKLVTALVALDIYSSDEILPVSEECTQVDSTRAWLYKNAYYKVSDILESLLVASGGDSACVLASGKISTDKFISLMNRKLSDHGINDTHLSNVIGLDSDDGTHYSTASDLYKIAVLAQSNKYIKKYVSTKEFVLKSSDGVYLSPLTNTNKLLWDIPGTVGIKTGKTIGAGEVLIYEYKDDLKDIYIVVMGSQDRFSDTKNILSWIVSSYTWN